MIEVYELLRRKENELACVRREIEALRTVTALLSEPEDIAALQPGPDPNPRLFLSELSSLKKMHYMTHLRPSLMKFCCVLNRRTRAASAIGSVAL